MDIPLVESAVTAAVAIASGAGAYSVRMRNRNRHQAAARAAFSAADVAYLDFNNPFMSVKLTVDSLLDQLGPRDSAAFRKRSAKVMAAADELESSYTNFAYSGDSANDPGLKHKRKTYMRLAHEYANYERLFKKRHAELEALATSCQQLQASIEGLAATQAGAERTVESAREAIATLIGEGWIMTDFELSLEVIVDLLQQATGSVDSREIITAQEELGEVRRKAVELGKSVRGLPQRQRILMRQADIFDRQFVALGRDFERADAGIVAVQGLYAEASYGSELAALAAAKLQFSRMKTLIAELREELKPERAAWELAEETARQIAQIVEAATTACGEATKLRETLADESEAILSDAAELREKIIDISLETHDRGGKQKKIRKALQPIDEEIVRLVRTLNEPLPDIDKINTRMGELEDLVERLDTASQRMDEHWDDDDDDIFKSIVGGATLAIGINLSAS